MPNLTIAFDAKRAFLNNRGLGNYSRDVIRLLTTYAPEHTYLLCTPSLNKERLSQSWFDPSLHVVTPHGLWSLSPSLWRTKGVLGDVGNADVYFGLSGELPYGIDRRPIRTVVTMHDAIFLRYPELYSPTYRWLFRRKVQYACDIADTVIAISEQTKRDLIEFFHTDERKIEVVYQGCSHIFRQPVSEEQVRAVKAKYQLPECYLLDVGAIEPRKNLKNLVLALATLPEYKDIPLIAVGGRTAYTAEVEQIARQLGINLRCLHSVAFADFPALYKGATVFCYPSVFEGFGIPILEAMCVGVPVLTSTGSCFAETGGEAALYADPLNVQEIGGQLQRVLADETLRQTMIAKGYAQARRFTDERVAENLCRVVLRQ